MMDLAKKEPVYIVTEDDWVQYPRGVFSTKKEAIKFGKTLELARIYKLLDGNCKMVTSAEKDFK